MFKCLECGNIFEDGEQKTWEEEHGLDTPPYEKVKACPQCKGTYTEAEQCQKCGEWFDKYDLTSGLCDDCIDSYRLDVDLCEKIGSTCRKDVQINSFYVDSFTSEQIEEILHKAIEQASKSITVDCSNFIDNDRSWFAEKVAEYEAKQI